MDKLKILLLLALSVPAWAGVYYFVTPTDMTGSKSDPAKAFAKKYSSNNMAIYYGNGKAVLKLYAETKPVTTDVTITNKTSEELKVITDPALSGFNANDFIDKKATSEVPK